MLKITDKIEKYKPIKCIDNKYIINWGLQFQKNNDCYATWYCKTYDYNPSIAIIKKDIEDFINMNTKNKIVNNFVWNGMKINLSIENQLDYKLLFDSTILQNSKNLPEKVKFEVNHEIIYYLFETIEEFKDFIIAMNNHIRMNLLNGWEEKMNVDYTQFKL